MSGNSESIRPGKRSTVRNAIAVAGRLHQRALVSHANARFEEARALCERSLRILELEPGAPVPDIANTLNTYGVIQQDLGLYAGSEAAFRRSVEIVQTLSGDSELERLRIRSWSHLADILRVQGRYGEAEPLFQHALWLAEANFGPNDLHVAAVLNGWAVSYKYSGRFDDAAQLYRRALEI